MMRAARFAAQLGFVVADDVMVAMQAMAERITGKPSAGAGSLGRPGLARRLAAVATGPGADGDAVATV